jgi:ribonuclease HI
MNPWAQHADITMPLRATRANAKAQRPAAERARRREAATINRAIDAALLATTPQPLHELTALRQIMAIAALADKVRRRATQLARRARAQRAALIQARDAIILALYAQAAPRGWMTAWCDGSMTETDEQHLAGIGGIIVDRHGHVIAQVARKFTGQSALEAEIAAASAVLALALDAGIARVRLHTDCKGLVHLWLNQRDDPRLAALRAQAMQVDRVHMRLVPRQHNQAAHRLARAAASGTDILGLGVKAKQMQPTPPDDSGESSSKDNE